MAAPLTLINSWATSGNLDGANFKGQSKTQLHYGACDLDLVERLESDPVIQNRRIAYCKKCGRKLSEYYNTTNYCLNGKCTPKVVKPKTKPEPMAPRRRHGVCQWPGCGKTSRGIHCKYHSMLYARRRLEATRKGLPLTPENLYKDIEKRYTKAPKTDGYIYVGRDATYKWRMVNYPEKLAIAKGLGFPDVTSAIEAVYTHTESYERTAKVFQMTKAGMQFRIKLMGIAKKGPRPRGGWVKIGRDCR